MAGLYILIKDKEIHIDEYTEIKTHNILMTLCSINRNALYEINDPSYPSRINIKQIDPRGLNFVSSSIQN